MRAFFDRLNASLAALAVALAVALAPGAALAAGFTLPDQSVIQGHTNIVPQIGAAPPVAVGCTISATASDAAGNCTASAASGTITFARTYTVAPVCVVWDQSATSTVSMPVYSVSATAITLSTIISTHVLGYFCFGGAPST